MSRQERYKYVDFRDYEGNPLWREPVTPLTPVYTIDYEFRRESVLFVVTDVTYHGETIQVNIRPRRMRA